MTRRPPDPASAPKRASSSRPSGSRKVNANDVARMAQVSRSAVSRTFTPGASVAPDTRARVLAAAAALGYRHGKRVEDINGLPTRRAAVVMANLYSPYFCHMYSMIEDELTLRGFQIVWRIVSDHAMLDSVVEELIEQDIDGMLVLSAVPGASVRKKVRAADISLVVLDRQDAVDGAALVWIDGPDVGRQVARLMLAEGRSRPACIAANPHRLTELQAFAAAMEAAGCAPTRWVDTGWTYENGVSAAQRLFSGNGKGGDGPPPDAVFAASDYLAIGVVDAARQTYGLRVPQDVSVVGFGDTSQSRWLSHTTSSVHLPLLSMVQTAVATMAARLGPAPGGPAPRIWLACDVIERETTKGLTFPAAQAAQTPPLPE
ncbi:substrate-binding domain-containing protein [Novosphingobium sp. FSY-8]|uniref:Substrate-binding domain-containing protein n=1 Tax=Novosphingobium ovatum TaxID=1908523 RepID=A0ABW9X9Y8_9SPHN|nr:substrate-binding domain-containing protein [Novosphingobium ovatum]NBC35351.1 substrate-binding domain-containing protein [Novosphingobium ovatum]